MRINMTDGAGGKMEKLCFGVDIGGTTIKLGMFNIDGEIKEKWEITTRKADNGKYILEDISTSILGKMSRYDIAPEKCVGIGIGVPGPVTKDGTVLKCVNLGWGVMSVAEKVHERTKVKNIKVANDANVAALGEMWKGGGAGYKNIVMVTLGTGVGGGIIIDGHILTGYNGAAGEIGHIVVNSEEEDECGCSKHGCLEQYASAKGIVRIAHRILDSTEEPSMLREPKRLSAKKVFDMAKEGDKVAIRVIDSFGRYLGLALAHVAQVVDPEVFVIGGGVSRAGQIVTDAVSKYYEENVMFALKNKQFNLAELGNEAGIYGSARMVIEK